MISVSSYTYFCLQKMLNSACMQSLKYIPWISNYWSDTKLKTVVKKAELKKDSPVPAPSRTPPRKTLLAKGSLSHTVSSRHTLSRSLCCRPQYVKVWFQRGFTARFTTAVLCFVLFLSSGSRYLVRKKKSIVGVSLRSIRRRSGSLQSVLYMEKKGTHPLTNGSEDPPLTAVRFFASLTSSSTIPPLGRVMVFFPFRNPFFTKKQKGAW